MITSQSTQFRLHAARRLPQSRRSHGVVLPVVLVILVIITALVVTQVRRTTIDQRMAANAQESVALEAAAKAVLGWCEVEVQRANRGLGGNAPRTMTAPIAPAAAAWRTAANWTASSYTPATGAALLAGISGAPQCLIEEATDELEGGISNDNDRGTGGRDCRWRKYRTTAQVQLLAPDLPGGVRSYFVQGEMRLYSNLACS
jgi:hypothetical protein